MKTKRPTALTALALATLPMAGLSATAARAHPILEATEPASDKANGAAEPQHGTSSPTTIRLTFSEGVMAKFCGLELKDSDGTRITTGPAATDSADGKRLLVPLKAPLAAGRYTVTWHAVSEDTHRVKGEYTFTIAP